MELKIGTVGKIPCNFVTQNGLFPTNFREKFPYIGGEGGTQGLNKFFQHSVEDSYHESPLVKGVQSHSVKMEIHVTVWPQLSESQL